MTSTRTEINKRFEIDSEAFEKELSEELHKLLRKPEHRKWWEDALTNNPSAYYCPGESDIDTRYGLFITKYLEEFDDKDLKNKYGGLPFLLGYELDVDRRIVIDKVLEKVGNHVGAKIDRKKKINWEQSQAAYGKGR